MLFLIPFQTHNNGYRGTPAWTRNIEKHGNLAGSQYIPNSIGDGLEQNKVDYEVMNMLFISTAFIVFIINAAMVMGPTPPGTGVI